MLLCEKTPHKANKASQGKHLFQGQNPGQCSSHLCERRGEKGGEGAERRASDQWKPGYERHERHSEGARHTARMNEVENNYFLNSSEMHTIPKCPLTFLCHSNYIYILSLSLPSQNKAASSTSWSHPSIAFQKQITSAC